MLTLLLKGTALVHVRDLMRPALRKHILWSKQCTKHKGGGIQSPVASDPRPRRSAPVSFPLLATLLTSLASDTAMQGKVRTKIAS